MENKKRNSSLDLLKIIAIIMVIASHYLNVQFGQALVNEKTMLGVSTHFIESTVVIACNVFLLITGYFYAKKRSISVRKAVNLSVTYLFYGVVIAALYILIARPSIDRSLISAIVSSIFDRWFIVFYLILYLLIPYINTVVAKLSKKKFEILLGILLFFFSLWPTFLTDVTLKDYGYGMVNFTTIYLIGTYLRLYGDKLLEKRKTIYLLGFLSLAATTAFSYFSFRAWNYCSPFIILQSLAMFTIFKNITIKENKIITRIASFSLAIYLIHENHLICKWLFQEVFKCKDVIGTWGYIPNIIVSTLTIFVACCLIEYVRTLIFKHTVDKALDKSKLLNSELSVGEEN